MATLKKMRQLARDAAADPMFRQWIKAWFLTWQELMLWTRAHFVYRDEENEVVRDPRRMLQDVNEIDGTGRIMGLEGDCDDISAFLAASVKVLGYPARFVAIRVNAETTEFEHVLAQAFDAGEWVSLDPTVSPGTVMTALDELIEVV